jgi:hypothetical protein
MKLLLYYHNNIRVGNTCIMLMVCNGFCEPFGRNLREGAPKSLRELTLADLEVGLATVRDGHEIVPVWRKVANY